MQVFGRFTITAIVKVTIYGAVSKSASIQGLNVYQ